MNRILNKIRDGKVLVADGAWGTQLQDRGLKPGECPELWNISNPERVYEVAKSYVDAGSDIISTNSFGGTVFRLREYKLEDKIYELNKAAAEISRKAAGEDGFVLASMGPSGKFLLMDDVEPHELIETFGDQAAALKEGGADAILVETMTDLTEATIAVGAAVERTGLAVACTFTFEKSAKGIWRTMMGQNVMDCIHEVKKAGASIVGANCGNGIAAMVDLAKEIRFVESDLPVLIQSNAGMPDLVDGEIVYPETPEYMASQVVSIIEAGANIIGGCCGTTPEHIREIIKAIR